MYEWNRISLVGKRKRKATGRYEYYYCSRPLKDKQHEFEITEVAWLYRLVASITRTKVDPTVRADWEMELGGVRFNGELDRGTMALPRVRERMRFHLGKCDNLLFVTTRGPERAMNLVEVGQDVAEVLCVATVDEVTANPWGRIWRTVDGRVLSIEKPDDKVVEEPRSFSTVRGV